MVNESRMSPTDQTQSTDGVVHLADIAPGTRVTDANGTAGAVVGVAQEERGAESGVQVAWADGTRTVVPLRALMWRADTLVVGAATMAPGVPETADGAVTVRTERTTDLHDGETLTVPVIEEVVTADTVWREAGSVHLRVRSETVPQTVIQETEREELHMEEVVVGRELAAGEQLVPRQEGDVLIVPIVEEEVVVTIRRVLAREVHITRRIARESHTVDTTTRRTVVALDPGTLTDRVHVAHDQSTNRPS